MNTILEKIIDNNQTHALWINTLSYLEYIGSRKIIKSQSSNQLTYDIIQHISEEARHALFFKSIGYKHFNNICPTYDTQYLLGGHSSSLYFQELDFYVGSEFEGNHYLSYLYVTLLVEERAIRVYQDYNDLLLKKNYKFSLNSILKEEERHLVETINELKIKDKKYNQRILALRKEEESFFKKFIKKIEDTLSSVQKERQENV